MRRVIASISHGIDKICRSAAVAFLSLMLLLVLFQVLARYIFQAVPVWTDLGAESVATGTTMSQPDNGIAGQAKRFYRLRVRL